MANNINGISTDITIDNKKLETIHSFKYLGAVVLDEGSKPEVLSRIAQTTAAVPKLKVIWNDKNIAISSKIKLMHSLAISIFLYACETWTITVDIERRIQALEMRCFCKLLSISYRDHITMRKWKPKLEMPSSHMRPPDFSEKMQIEVVQARHTITWTCQDYPTGNSSRREMKRQTEEMMGRQHQRVDWPWMEYHTVESWEPQGVEEAGCRICNGARLRDW